MDHEENIQEDKAAGLGLCAIGPHLSKRDEAVADVINALSFQMIHPVSTSSAGVTWSLSTGSATTNFMENSAVGHVQGRTEPGASSSFSRQVFLSRLQTTEKLQQGLKNGQMASLVHPWKHVVP